VSGNTTTQQELLLDGQIALKVVMGIYQQLRISLTTVNSIELVSRQQLTSSI